MKSHIKKYKNTFEAGCLNPLHEIKLSIVKRSKKYQVIEAFYSKNFI